MRSLPSFANHGAGPFDSRLFPSYIVGTMVFAVALAIRFAVNDILPPGFPYLTFFPAVIIVTFVGGLWPGILVALLCGISSWYFFIPPVDSFSLTGGALLALGFYIFIVGVDIYVINLAIGALAGAERIARENERLAEFQALMIQELNHRIKNVFSVVASVVKMSARYAESPVVLAEEATERIMALSRSHAAIWQVGKERDATVRSVAQLILEPFMAEHGNQIMVSGDSDVLDAQTVQILSLIFHELATNSAKYGALAQPAGKLQISSTSDAPKKNAFKVVWREEGNVPFVQPQQKRGFGSEMIERLVSSAGGHFERVFNGTAMTITVSFQGTEADT